MNGSMNEQPADGARPLSRKLKFAGQITLWAVGGYLVGALVARSGQRWPWLDAMLDRIEAAGWLANIAALFAFGLIAAGIYMFVLNFLPDRQFRVLTAGEEDEDPKRLRRMMPIAAMGALLYAAIILVFLIPGIPAMLGVGIGVVAFALTGWLFWRGTAMMDELERVAQREALVAAFMVVEALAILWALLAHYGLAPALEPLAVVLVVTLVYIGAAVTVSIRRGVAV